MSPTLMSPTESMIWFIFMAVATTTILVTWALGGMGLFSRDQRADRSARRAAQRRRRHDESIGR